MISERLKQVRLALGYDNKQKEFAEILDMKQGSYSDVERGKTKSISKKILRNLYLKFGVNEKFLFNGELPIFLSKEEKGYKNIISTPDSNQQALPEQLNRFMLIVEMKDKQIEELISQQGELIRQQKKLIEAILNLTQQK